MNADDRSWMEAALDLAREAGKAGEVPIGAVVVGPQGIVGRGRNRMEELRDATAHAEILAIREASTLRGDWRLDDLTLYATLEPCPMCAGAILNSRIQRVVYAARDFRLGACQTHWAILAHNPIGRSIQVEDGLLEESSARLLKDFFRGLRKERPAGRLSDDQWAEAPQKLRIPGEEE